MGFRLSSWIILPTFLVAAWVRSAEGFVEGFSGSLAERWTAIGELNVSRDTGEGEPFVRIRGEGGSMLVTRAETEPPDYLNSAMLSLRCRAPEATDEAPVSFEIQLHSGTRRGARFWRRIDLADSDWHEIAIPLAFLRHSGGFSMRWEEVERFGFYLRSPAVLDLDRIEFSDPKGEGPRLTPERLQAVAFPEPAQSAIHRAGPFSIVTDASIDEGSHAEELIRLRERIAVHFPAVLEDPPVPIPLVVFEAEEDFRAFWPRFAEAFNSAMEPPTAGGYAALGVAATWQDRSRETIRPVLFHEACHALLERAFGISNTGEWLHEGLANFYQLHWSGQDLVELTAPRVREGRLAPLVRLADGSPIGMDLYADAALFVQFLLDDSDRLGRLRAAVAKMAESGSTALAPLAEEFFGQSLEQLEARWLEWAASVSSRSAD